VGKTGLPVKVGDSKGAFRFNAVCAAVLTGLSASAVLSALPKPTIDLVIPPTVPVKFGEAKGALSANPGTVGAVALPPKSPANCTLPVAVVVASGAPAAKLVFTNSVVASLVELSLAN